MQQPVKTTLLSHFDVLGIQGRDAVAFAHAQFCNDVLELAVGHWQFNAWLTPKGRVLSLFALLKVSDERLVLALPGTCAERLAERLRGFVFRSKLAIVPGGFAAACGGSGDAAPQDALGNRMSGSPDDGLWLDFGGDGGPRWLVLLPEGVPAAPSDPGVDAWWRLQDLRHGLPRIELEHEAGWTPQMLSLDRLGAYSVKKGCYPGQEIVARTHFLGQAKRGLVRLRADAPLSRGAVVSDPGDAALGPLIDVAVDVDACEALAVLALDHTGGMHIDGRAVSTLPLLGGLKR